MALGIGRSAAEYRSLGQSYADRGLRLIEAIRLLHTCGAATRWFPSRANTTIFKKLPLARPACSSAGRRCGWPAILPPLAARRAACRRLAPARAVSRSSGAGAGASAQCSTSVPFEVTCRLPSVCRFWRAASAERLCRGNKYSAAGLPPAQPNRPGAGMCRRKPGRPRTPVGTLCRRSAACPRLTYAPSQNCWAAVWLRAPHVPGFSQFCATIEPINRRCIRHLWAPPGAALPGCACCWCCWPRARCRSLAARSRWSPPPMRRSPPRRPSPPRCPRPAQPPTQPHPAAAQRYGTAGHAYRYAYTQLNPHDYLSPTITLTPPSPSPPAARCGPTPPGRRCPRAPPALPPPPPRRRLTCASCGPALFQTALAHSGRGQRISGR